MQSNRDAAAKTVTFILAGGKGRRLNPLTRYRPKPLVPFGGAYRIIDFALSNCLNSGLDRVFVLTQPESESIRAYLRKGWISPGPGLSEFASFTPPAVGRHYLGTADAVLQNLPVLEKLQRSFALILPADLICKMDYRALLSSHAASGADVTIVTAECPHLEGASKNTATGLADTGIYVFNYETLRAVAQMDGTRMIDFSADLIARILHSGKVNAWGHEGQANRTPLYWRDITAPEDYYDSNMDLLACRSCIDPYDKEWPIHSADPIQVDRAHALSPIGRQPEVNSIIPSSVSLRKACVYHSVLFPGVVLESAAYVRHSVLLPGAVIGAGAAVRRAIVDANVVIDAGDRIGYNREEDRRRFRVMPNGVVVVSADDISSPFSSDLDFMRRTEKVYERRSEVTVFARTSELFRKRAQRVD